MRYRPFTNSGLSTSAISLMLDDAAIRGADRTKLIYAAMEAGVNNFELATASPDAARALGEAIASVGRRMLVVTARVGRAGVEAGEPPFSPQGLRRAIEAALAHSGAERLDAAVLDAPQAGELTPAAVEALDQAKADGLIRFTGLAGEAAATDGYLAASAFDLLATSFNLRSAWKERNRIRAAVERGMTVTGFGFMIDRGTGTAEGAARPTGLARFFRRRADVEAAHRYDFLNGTPGWTAEQISLAFALTEPSLATVRVRAKSLAHLQSLAETVERELPTNIAAQIEMARFSELA